MRRSLPRRSSFAVPLCVLALAAPGTAQETAKAAAKAAAKPEANPVAHLPWRALGPVNMSGRITDFEVVGSRPGTWYVASASGGLWKTENAGTTWIPQFQDQGTASIGDVAIAESDPDIVWVGTGEENARNSVAWGDGVYKSTDAGKSWQRMGLEKSFQIGHIAIHPEDANLVYVAALGRLWGPNEERGLYRSRDGGKSWQKILYLDDKTGCIDVRLDPHDPDTLYAVMYERMRDMYDGNDPAVRFGAKSGIYRSVDGGATWERMRKGLPSCKWGRAAIEPWAKRRGTLFALIESERSGWARGDAKTSGSRARAAYMGVDILDHEKGARLENIGEDSPAKKAGIESGDIVTALNGKKIGSAEDLGDSIDECKTGDKVKLAVARGDKQLELDLTFGSRPTAGNGRYYPRLGGQQGNVQSRQGELGHETGGLYRSDDHGVTWTRLNSLIPRPFYFCAFTVDPRDDKTIYVCGIQLWKSSDGGKRFRTCNRNIHVDFHDIWVDPQDSDHVIALSDGGVNVSYDQCKTWEVVDNICLAQFYHVGVDQELPYNVYGGLQDNGTWGGPSRTRYSSGVTKDDWIKIYSGDGFGAAVDPADANTVYATSQLGGLGRVDLRTGSTSRISKPRQVAGVRCRFNWDTPFFLSPHNKQIFYFAGNFAFRSLDRGAQSSVISKKLSLTDRGTATAFAESPRRAGLLYVGTDDGAAWVTRDAGTSWSRIDENLPDMPGPRYISCLTPSHHTTGRVYLALDGHRSDDLSTYLFVSTDYGKSWESLASGLPTSQPVHVVTEDRRNTRLLFVGTEFGCYASLDRGRTFTKLGSGLPTVAVRDLVIHDRESELVAATHGRGMFVLDVEPLRQLSRRVKGRAAFLFAPHVSYLWRSIPRYLSGHKTFRAPRAPYGSSIYLYLKEKPEAAPAVVIKDLRGTEIATLKGKRVAGVQRIQWNARRQIKPKETDAKRAAAKKKAAPPRRGSSSSRRRGPRWGPRVPPGTYQVTFTHDDKAQVQALELRADPGTAAARIDTHPLSRN